jgi:hypothetical protein
MTTEREQKKQLTAKIERFLFEKVEWEQSLDGEVGELQSIIDTLIALKFEGGPDRVASTVVDTNKFAYIFQKVPFPTDGKDIRVELATAVLSVSAWLQSMSHFIAPNECN